MTLSFFLGSNQSLSVAEVMAVGARYGLLLNSERLLAKELLLVETDSKIDPVMLIASMGGIIKIGEVLAEFKDLGEVKQFVIKDLLAVANERVHFGFSCYGVQIARGFGLDVKTALIQSGKKARWVVSREQVLSSVVVEQNKIIQKGAEYSIVKEAGRIFVIKTLVVQPFKELSRRDYGRPGRDDESGMLPPKLAQIMLNLGLVSSEKKVLDPFCGSGTVLSEALLLGVTQLIGSDISERAVKDTEINIDWTVDRFKIDGVRKAINQLSATELSVHHKASSIDLIATEPFLGPQRGTYDVRQVVGDLEKLYSNALMEFYKILKPGGRVVMVWPVFKTKTDRIFMPAKIAGNFKVIRAISVELEKQGLKLTNRSTLMYGRPDQRVWREIVILEK